MSNIAGHLAHGTKIGQFSKIEMEVEESTVVQVDGEPFRLPPGRIRIEPLENKTYMLELSKDLKKRVGKLLNGREYSAHGARKENAGSNAGSANSSVRGDK